MSIKANKLSVADTYTKTKQTMVNVLNICKSSVSRIDNGELDYSLLADDLIPNLKNLSNSLRDPSTLSAEWVQALGDYAASQTTDNIDFLGLYVEIRNKILTTITYCVNQLPTENGYIAIYTIGEDGVKTKRKSVGLCDVKVELNLLIGLIE